MQSRYHKPDKILRRSAVTNKTPRQTQNFHPKTFNTDITFTDHEIKGPKYNLHPKKKNWIENPALEAETAISHLPLAPQTET